VRVPIGERVRAAHLSHFCPGGLGFPVTSPSTAGVDLEHAHFIRQSWLIVADHAAQPANRICARCAQPIAARHDVRRRVCGDWVHESCPLAPG
jgi:ribosomal protein S27AE